MQEVWRPVIGYEGIYEVSNFGNVKSIKFSKEVILKFSISENNYKRVTLFNNGIKKTKTAHQLVAEAFLGHKPCGYKLVIDHVNNDKLDNRLENLQIVSQRFNVSKKNGRFSSKFVGVCWNETTNKWRSQITINGKVKHLGYFKTEIEAHKAYISKLKTI